MSRKMNFIPHIPDYKWIREQMKEDLKYRLETRNDLTSLGKTFILQDKCSAYNDTGMSLSLSFLFRKTESNERSV